MEIVINASSLIVLSKIGRLSLLNELFAKVYIPSAVLEEINAAKEKEMRLDLSSVDIYLKTKFENNTVLFMSS